MQITYLPHLPQKPTPQSGHLRRHRRISAPAIGQVTLGTGKHRLTESRDPTTLLLHNKMAKTHKDNKELQVGNNGVKIVTTRINKQQRRHQSTQQTIPDQTELRQLRTQNRSFCEIMLRTTQLRFRHLRVWNCTTLPTQQQCPRLIWHRSHHTTWQPYRADHIQARTTLGCPLC